MPYLPLKTLSRPQILYAVGKVLIYQHQAWGMLRRLPLLALFVVVVLSGAAPTALAQENATVQGTVYDLWTFTPLDNVWVEVRSDSALIHKELFHGTYSLSLALDNYTIKAEYYSGTTVVYEAEENIELKENRVYTLDLIMFPAFEENELPENYDILPEEGWEEAAAGFLWLGLVAALIIVVAGVIIFYHRKILGLVEKEVAAPTRVVGLPDDLNEVLNIVRESGGRINQVELRQKLPYSEAKVSLMIADLEDRGLIRKIRKGRGNIIVLTELEK